MLRRRRSWLLALVAFALLVASCGDSDGDATSLGQDVTPSGSGDGGDGGSDGDGSTGDDAGSGGDAGSDGDDGPDNDDAAAIVGQTTLPEDVEELLDDIDDVVSLGECQSEIVGLGLTAPDGWMCRVLDAPIGGMDGFTLFTDGNQLNLTIGTPSNAPSACEALQLCNDAVPISLSDNFPDTMSLEIVGTVTIWGTYKNSDAELVITSLSALTDDDLAFLSGVLDSVVEVS